MYLLFWVVWCVLRYGFVYFSEDVNIQSIIDVSGSLFLALLLCCFVFFFNIIISSVHIFEHSNRSILRAGNLNWVLPSWRTGALVCILIHFSRTSVDVWSVVQIQDLNSNLIFFTGSMPSRLVGPAAWISPTQYICCSCCSAVGGGMAQPSPIFNGGSPYSQVTNEHTLNCACGINSAVISTFLYWCCLICVKRASVTF